MNLALDSFNDLPRFTRWLAVSFFAGWLLELIFGARLNLYFGLVPRLVAGSYWLWQPVTYIFIHAGFWHFVFNAFTLWMLGRFLEPEMGAGRFLRFFIFCGLAAGLLTVIVSPGSGTPVIGASGAVYGLLMAFAFYCPDMKVYLYFIFPLTARQLVIALAVLEFTMSFAVSGSQISNITHLSGLLFGWLYLKAGGWAVGGGSLPRRLYSLLRTRRDTAASEEFKGASFETDALLEKIAAKGLGSLSKAELEKLKEHSRWGRS